MRILRYYYFINLFFLVHCATLSSRENLVFVRSDQLDAQIYVNGELVGEDSAVWGSPKWSSLQVEARKEGFEPAKAEIETRFNWFTFANIFYLGASVIGFAIDYFSDSLFYYAETSKVLKLTPKTKFAKMQHEIPDQSLDIIDFELEGTVYLVNLQSVTLGGIYSEKEEISSKDKFISGYYTLKGTVINQRVTSRKVGGKYQYSYTTYKAPKRVEQIIRIQPNGETIICGVFDEQNKTSSVSVFFISDTLIQKYKEGRWYLPENPYRVPNFRNACPNTDNLKKDEYLFHYNK